MIGNRLPVVIFIHISCGLYEFQRMCFLPELKTQRCESSERCHRETMDRKRCGFILRFVIVYHPTRRCSSRLHIANQRP